MSNLISGAEAFKRINDSNTVFADVRFVLGQPNAGYEAYLQAHLPEAVFFDLNKDLSGPIEKHGGGHPLPSPEIIAHKLGLAGINEDTDVIVYDDQGGSIAARLWWILRYLGHERVKMLDCGFSGWKAAGYPLVNLQSNPAPKQFTPYPQEDMQATMLEVTEGLGLSDRVLIDSRTLVRFTGEEVTKYPRSGHIPGAIHRYWEGGLSEEGVFLGAAAQTERFKDIPVDKEITVYCGAGVTACPNVLALYEAGYSKVKLYVGSWSDWVSYADNPIETGAE